jgi:hypothetical protein
MNLIKQGQLSSTIGGFAFIHQLNLKPISDYNEPAIFFGMYSANERDWDTLMKMKSQVTIFWGGGDSHNIKNSSLIKDINCRNITCTVQTAKNLNKHGIECEVLPLGQFFFKNHIFKPITKQNKIYSYIPSSNPNYYNKPLIDELNLGNKLLVGSSPKVSGINQLDWSKGKGLECYSNCYLGLQLGLESGGGAGIVEMGLCGIKVITNVLKAPNTISWETKEDILNTIKLEEKSIGTTNVELANQVREWMVNDIEYLKIK